MKTVSITVDHAKTILALLNYNIDSENKTEYQPIVKAINNSLKKIQVSPKSAVIDKIKTIINDWSSFRMTDDVLSNESSIIVSQTGKTSICIDSFHFDCVECTEYVNDIETDDITYNYFDLSLETLEAILNLAEIVDADYGKTKKIFV